MGSSSRTNSRCRHVKDKEVFGVQFSVFSRSGAAHVPEHRILNNNIGRQEVKQVFGVRCSVEAELPSYVSAEFCMPISGTCF